MRRDGSGLNCPHRWFGRALWLPFGAWNILIWWRMGQGKLKFNRRDLNGTNDGKWLESPSKSCVQPPSHKMLEMARKLWPKPTSLFLKVKERTKRVKWQAAEGDPDIWYRTWCWSQTLWLLSHLFPITSYLPPRAQTSLLLFSLLYALTFVTFLLAFSTPRHACAHLHAALYLVARSIGTGNLAF